MSRETLLAAAAGAVAGLFLVPAFAIHPASAAQLHVTAAPIQIWTIVHGLPELPTEPEEAVVPETVEEAPGSTEAGSDAESEAGDDGGHEGDGAGKPTGPSEPGTSPDESPSQEPPAEDPPADPAPADESPAPAQQVVERVTEVTQDVTAP